MKFSSREIGDLLFAWFMISIAFAILFLDFSSINFNSMSKNFLLSFFGVGTAFFLHELGHKFVAQNYGYYAEFHAFKGMLFLAVLMSFFGFIFAAPGGVLIKGRITLRKNGIISLAGPLINIVLGFLFFTLFLIFKSEFFHFSFIINSFIGLFNLIPVIPFDGGKIIAWNKVVYFIVLLTALIIFVFRYFI